MDIVFITGLSGAGRSQAMKAFEDNGYYCIDNMPPSLIPKFVELLQTNSEEIKKIALVVDIRGGIFFDDFEKNLEMLQSSGNEYKIIYLEASDGELIKRFKEARRTHPLKPKGSISDGIAAEREKLKFLRDKADYIIDTTGLNLSKFKQSVMKYFKRAEDDNNVSISFVSFGFKRGIPPDADMVFDLRMLPNPHYVEELKEYTGNDERVQKYVMSFKNSVEYMDKIIETVTYLIPLTKAEGRKQFVVCLGCTGGKHRSVTFANKLYDKFKSDGYPVEIYHRELEV